MSYGIISAPRPCNFSTNTRNKDLLVSHLAKTWPLLSSAISQRTPWRAPFRKLNWAKLERDQMRSQDSSSTFSWRMLTYIRGSLTSISRKLLTWRRLMKVRIKNTPYWLIFHPLTSPKICMWAIWGQLFKVILFVGFSSSWTTMSRESTTSVTGEPNSEC